MRAWTLVTDAIAPVGRREASTLAARGKDLVLLGDARGLLEEIAAELRVVHRVDVRIFVVDLAAPDAAAEVLRWIDARELTIDAVVTVRWADADPARAAQAEAQTERLAARLGAIASTFAGIRRAGASLPPASTAPRSGPPRARRSVVPPGAPAPRSRTTTARGHRDPSVPPDAG